MNISFLSSGHFPFDDRIFYHFARTLSERGHKIEITSSKSNEKNNIEGIGINCFDGDNSAKREKIRQFIMCLDNFDPDIVICSEPLPVLASKKYARNGHPEVPIIYDITERYPSWKDLVHLNWFRRRITFIKLLLFNLFSASLADAFIFGEWHKSLPYRILFPFKPYAYITYYPDLKYLNYAEPAAINENLKLLYSGRISLERGIGSFISVICHLAEKKRSLKFEVKIIGWYESPDDERECEGLIQSLYKEDNISLSISGRQTFTSFCEIINSIDIFLELRADNFSNRHSLPIKLFYFMAAGKPVIISDLKAIKREVNVENFGFLVNPKNTDAIVSILTDYLEKNDIYLLHSRNARKMAEEKYNWQQISPAFIKFIESFSPV